jgi:hypothetical protein
VIRESRLAVGDRGLSVDGLNGHGLDPWRVVGGSIKYS